MTLETEGLKIDLGGKDSLYIPQAKQTITFKEERSEYNILEAYSLSYGMQMERVEGELSMKMYQWVLSFVEMALVLKVKTKIRSLLIGMLANDYNAAQTSEESRIREIQEDMEVTVEAATLALGIHTCKGPQVVSLQAGGFKFKMHDDLSICAYTVEANSLVMLAEQHRKLPILKLKQLVFVDSSNKSLRKHTSI